MTRVSVYGTALVAFVAATAMMVVSIATPNWVSYSVVTPLGERVEKKVGLQKSCSSLENPPCSDFPPASVCKEAAGVYFCSLWRTAGFMASFATILCLACLVGFFVIMRGGKYKRETGWPIVAGMLSLVAVVELAIISIVSYLFDHDDQFGIPGWHLDYSWYLGTVSAVVCLVAAVGLSVSAYLLPPQEGYEFLEDPIDT